jgi:hypothetical protein
MPPRWLRGLIVAGWLAAAGWFVSRDIWPSFRRDDAPPYFVNLAEETTLTQGSSHVTRWSIYRGRVEIGKEIGKAKTWIDYLPGPDAFDLHSELTLQRPDGRGLFRAVLALPRLVGDLFVLAVATPRRPGRCGGASGRSRSSWRACPGRGGPARSRRRRPWCRCRCRSSSAPARSSSPCSCRS